MGDTLEMDGHPGTFRVRLVYRDTCGNKGLKGAVIGSNHFPGIGNMPRPG
jgi:hypothetical protein